MPPSAPQSDIGPPLVYLMRGVLYRDQHPEPWQAMLRHSGPIADYLSVIGLELDLDEAEGYAFLKQKTQPITTAENDEEAGSAAENELPKLIRRRPLGFGVSILLVLLRKRLLENDASGDVERLVLQREQIIEMLRVFLPAGSNEARLIDQIDTHIKKAIDLGFVHKLTGQDDGYEVRRVLRAFVDAQWLSDFNQRLERYRQHAQDA